MSSRSTPRLHRLPVRTDYVLVPAPLDISLPQMTEKSTLPAIIVTPCSPSSARDFSIAFIQPPPKQSLRERLATSYSTYTFSSSSSSSHTTTSTTTSARLRSIILLLLLLFVLLCHIATHQLAAAYRPRMEMSQTGETVHVEGGQKAFSWSRIMGVAPLRGAAERHPAGVAAAAANAAGVGAGVDGAANYDGVGSFDGTAPPGADEVDILGIALDGAGL